MTDEDWLRAGLADAVPEPPGAPDRAASALARARRARRRTTVLGAAGVAATLAAVGLVASLGDGRSPDRVASEPTSPLDVAGCPAEPVDALTQVGPDHVPDGALSVRLCDGGAVRIDVPQDALVTDVDAVAAAVNELEIADPGRMCTADLGPGYQLVFAYADGSTVVADGGLYSCREVVVNGVERIGADAPLERFTALLREQRDELEPPASVDTSGMDCASPMGSPTAAAVGRPEDLTVAVYCAEDVVGSGAWRRAEIVRADLDVLLADLRKNARANAGYVDCDVRPPVPRIVGTTAWGDRVDLRAECTNGWFTVDASTNTVWSPDAGSRAVLDRLFAAAE